VFGLANCTGGARGSLDWPARRSGARLSEDGLGWPCVSSSRLPTRSRKDQPAVQRLGICLKPIAPRLNWTDECGCLFDRYQSKAKRSIAETLLRNMQGSAAEKACAVWETQRPAADLTATSRFARRGCENAAGVCGD